MVGLALRGLRLDPLRSTLSVLALASAVAVLLLFEGFRTGLYAQLRAFPEQLDADLIVSQAGVGNLAAARSSLPQRTRRDVLAVDGVASAHAITSIPLIFRRQGITTPVQVIGYVDVGGPANIVEGRAIAGEREIVIDRSLAVDHALSAGDEVEVLGWTFRVAGVSEGTAAMFTPAVFVRFEDLVNLYVSGDLPEDLPADPPLLSYMLVRGKPGAGLPRVAAALEDALAYADVHTPAELGAADERMGRRLMGPVLGLLVALSYVIGALAVGLTMFGSVLSRIRDFAVMGALGSDRRDLAAVVLAEALVVAALAFGLGIAGAAGAAHLVELTQPDYQVTPLAGGSIPRTAGAVFALALFGAWLPLRRVWSVDPALVFRGGPC